MGRVHTEPECYVFARDRLKDLDEFHQRVGLEGCELLRRALDANWHQAARRQAARAWTGQSVPSKGVLLPYQWLAEYGDWDVINRWLPEVERLTGRSDDLARKLKSTASVDWSQAEAAALEVAALCRFASAGVLKGMNVRPQATRPSNVDVLLILHDRPIYLEITKIMANLVHPKVTVGVMSVPRMEHQLRAKLRSKVGKRNHQLALVPGPALLAVARPRMGGTQETCRWLLQDELASFPNCSAVIVSDSFRFRTVRWYCNPQASHPLLRPEVDALSAILAVEPCALAATVPVTRSVD